MSAVVRVGRGDKSKWLGGYPTQLKGSLSRPCPACDASPGQRCMTWRVQHGERLYPIGPRCKPHPERVHQT